MGEGIYSIGNPHLIVLVDREYLFGKVGLSAPNTFDSPSLQQRNVPLRLVLMIAFHPFNEISSAGAMNCPPALFTKKSREPNREIAVDMRLSTWKCKHIQFNSIQFNIFYCPLMITYMMCMVYNPYLDHGTLTNKINNR